MTEGAGQRETKKCNREFPPQLLVNRLRRRPDQVALAGRDVLVGVHRPPVTPRIIDERAVLGGAVFQGYSLGETVWCAMEVPP